MGAAGGVLVLILVLATIVFVKQRRRGRSSSSGGKKLQGHMQVDLKVADSPASGAYGSTLPKAKEGDYGLAPAPKGMPLGRTSQRNYKANLWQIDYNDIVISRELAKGTYGDVYKVSETNTMLTFEGEMEKPRGGSKAVHIANGKTT